jgi:hypothetical protein
VDARTTLFLSRADIARLTGKRRFSAQRRALDEMGVRYTIAATGEPLVREAALDRSGISGRNSNIPRWDRLNNV